MGYTTLRQCIADLERTGQLVRIDQEVDPYLEAAEIQRRVYQAQGPAVFFELKQLKPGDTVTVGLSSGQHVVFSVMLVRQYPKDAFPTADVYGARPDPELRLITCGGEFAAGHYLDNIVVYANLRTV